MAKVIELIKIEDLPKFDANDFCMDPKKWGFTGGLYYDLGEVKTYHRARDNSKNVKAICIALVHDNRNEDYVFSDLCCVGKAMKFVLFNAEECNKEKAQVRGYVYCPDEPTVKVEKFFRYRPDSIV